MKKIYILGFGCADKGDITLSTLDILKKSDRVFVRTIRHPAAEILTEYNIQYISFDDLYDSSDTFDEVYSTICDTVLASDGDIVSYIVPGSASFAEKAVNLILNKATCEVKIVPAVSFLDGTFALLKKDAGDGFKLIDALNIAECPPDVDTTNVIVQVYDKTIASDVKLDLMRFYPDETKMYIVKAAGSKDECICECMLYECDQVVEIDHLTTFVLPPCDYLTSTSSFSSLVKIIDKLRAPDGCPWDLEQTHISLKRYMIEEAYECINAIDNNDDENLIEELGDVLLQVMLHSKIAQQENSFDIYDVIKTVSEKMIYRHPHVFAGQALSKDLLVQWEELKQNEHKLTTPKEKLDNIPKQLPALMYAEKLLDKTTVLPNDFDDEAKTFNIIGELLCEYREQREKQNRNACLEISGKILFSMVNLMRLNEIDPENVLKNASNEYLSKF